MLILSKLKMLGSKNNLVFDKNAREEILLELQNNSHKTENTEINNQNLLRKHFIVKMTSCVFKSSHLKRRVAGAQESKHCKLGHRLETAS